MGGRAGSEAHTDLLGNLNELHLSGHVAQRPHAGTQLPAADVAVLVSVKLLEGDLQLCRAGQSVFFPMFPSFDQLTLFLLVQSFPPSKHLCSLRAFAHAISKIHSLSKYLRSIEYVPSSALGSGDVTMEKGKERKERKKGGREEIPDLTALTF